MAFREYEEQVNLMIADQRSIILCTYPLTSSPGDHVFDVAHIHQLAVARRNGNWETVETPALKQAKAEINRLNQELEQKVEERTTELRRVNEELRAEIAERKLAEMQSRTLVDAIPHQIWSGPGDGTLDYCNERWRSYMGLEQEDLIGDGWQNMLHPDDRERVLKAWHESVSNGTPYQQEKRHRGADGTYRWFLSLGVPLRDPEGRIVRWYGTNTDIEDRKRAEEALRESDARFRRLLSSNIIGVAFWNLNGEISEANDLFLETIGYTREDLCRGEVDWKKLTPPEYAAKDAKAIDELLATGTCTPFEKEYVRKDGERVAVLIGSALFDVEKQTGSSFILDITERKQNEERLREYEKVVEGLEEMIVVVDRDYRYLLANRAFLKYRGVEWEDLVGHLAPELLAEGVFENVVKEKLDECLRGKPVQYEMKYCYPQHGERDLLISYFPIEGRAGIDRVACVLQDITERKKAEAALRESETRFRQIAENIEEMFWITDLKGSKTIYMSPAYERITGRSCESLYAAPKSWREDIHPEDRPRMEATFASDPGSTGDHSYRIVRPDGSIRWIRDRGFPVRDESGEVVRFAGIAEDITASKCAEKELQQVNEQLRVLSRRLFQVRDEERRHLARELHDEIGQTLTAAKINLDSIGRSRASDQTSRLNETITILDKLLRQVRQISLDLHPSLLDDLGLAPALRSLLDQQARRAGWRAQFSAVEPLANIKRGIQTTGFRIAQEAITNILRHANAGFVSVHLRTEAGELRMKIIDDGRGFDLAEIEGHTCPDGGFGLMGMRERAASVGGRVQIVSSPGTGTTVEVSLPLNGSGHGQSG
jgi:PAS domain S-box-containing protein